MTRKTIAGENEQIWQQINQDLHIPGTIGDYHVLIQKDNHNIKFDTTSSPGGGDEGGYSITSFSSPLTSPTNFRFDIHPEDFINRLGKLFGGQDVVIGYPEFDNNLIVKTTDAQQVKTIFANPQVREVFQGLSGFSLSVIDDEDSNGSRLEFTVQRLLNNVELPRVFNAFTHILGILDGK
ncbi:MAG: hypothetical protein JWQ96_2859 [Segetibacter sp.]|nr:hypothetical protein [Segetibacter sp.]